MTIYKLDDSILSYVDEKPFKLEKDIQNLCEQNLESLLGLELVKSEFTVGNYRIDSLAYDKAQNSFVIIEYKRSDSRSVVDQGYAYLSTMLNNKADFVLEYNESRKTPLRKNNVEWSQSKVIFIAPSFNAYQKEAINFKDLPIELWEIKRYANNVVSFVQINPINSTESINTIKRDNKAIEKVNSEIKVYSEKYHLDGKPQEIIELYDNLKSYVLNFGDDVVIRAKKYYIGFIKKTNFCDIKFTRNNIKIYLNLKFGQLNDPMKLARDVSKIGTTGNGDYEILLFSTENLEYIVGLIKQSYNNKL